MIDIFIALWLAMTFTLDLYFVYEFYKIQDIIKASFNKQGVMLDRRFLILNFIFLLPICFLLAPYGIYKLTFYPEQIKKRLFLMFLKTFKENDD